MYMTFISLIREVIMNSFQNSQLEYTIEPIIPGHSYITVWFITWKHTIDMLKI